MSEMWPKPSTELLDRKVKLLGKTEKGLDLRVEGTCTGYSELVATMLDERPRVVRMLIEVTGAPPTWYGITESRTPDPGSMTPWCVEMVE